MHSAISSMFFKHHNVLPIAKMLKCSNVIKKSVIYHKYMVNMVNYGIIFINTHYNDKPM